QLSQSPPTLDATPGGVDSFNRGSSSLPPAYPSQEKPCPAERTLPPEKSATCSSTSNRNEAPSPTEPPSTSPRPSCRKPSGPDLRPYPLLRGGLQGGPLDAGRQAQAARAEARDSRPRAAATALAGRTGSRVAGSDCEKQRPSGRRAGRRREFSPR